MMMLLQIFGKESDIMYNIKITAPAKKDIKSAISYIANDLHNPQAAENTLNLFEKEINTLSELPMRQPLVKDEFLAQNGFRIIQVNNYLVFYTVREEEKQVTVQRVLYNRRDWMNLLK